MEDYAMWDGYNIFGVIFLIVFVVGLSCGLLGFICTRLIEDNYGGGIKPVSVFGHRTAANGMILVTPTKITVTRPPKEESLRKKEEELENVPKSEKEGNENGAADGEAIASKTVMSKIKDFSMFKRQAKFDRDGSPEEKIIYSSNNSPTASIKRFFWSKNNNFDYTANKDSDPNGSDKTDIAVFGQPICFDEEGSDKNKNVRVEIDSNVGMYNRILSSRCYSAPSRPHVNRTDTILYI